MSTMLGGMLPDKWLFCTHGAGEQSGQQGKGRVFTRDKMPQLSEFPVFLITLPKTRLSCPALHYYLSSFGPPGDSTPAAPPSTMSALSAEEPVIPCPAFLVLRPEDLLTLRSRTMRLHVMLTKGPTCSRTWPDS